MSGALRIGIDGRNLMLPKGTGIATHSAVLTRSVQLVGMEPAVLRAGPRQQRASRWLAAARGGTSRARPEAGGWVADDLFRIAQVQFDMGRGLRQVHFAQPPDIMHWTSPLPLRALGSPAVVTLHDLIPLLHPGLTGTRPRRQRRMLALILRSASHIVSVSEATRREAIRHLGLAPERVTNVWQAVDVAEVADSASAGLMRGGYWLHVGAVERRKNLVRLIRAWRASGVTGPLVLAGPDGWQVDEVTAERAGDPGIVRLDWLARPGLLALIRDARALLMPSLAEGFGLPLAEAMALGTPALIAGGGALEEVAGGAALVIDPGSTRSIAEGMAALDRDPGLRRGLAAAGLLRAGLFTPAAYAARLEPVYRAVLGDLTSSRQA